MKSECSAVKSAENLPLFGFLNVYKPQGLTSHDVVAKMRRITKVKQIGHTGTLDPFAEGVLPVCIGKSTRLIEYLADDKEYLAFVKFGIETDTYDLEGEVVAVSEQKVSEAEISEQLQNFRGEIYQMPPIYSAIKVKGKKLYEYAREGKNVEIQPRKVTIEKVELRNFDYVSQTAQILIKCSKGTYIRSIAHDLGKNLGCGAHLVKLIRTQAGKFFMENSIPLESFENLEIVCKNLINPVEVLDAPKIIVSEHEHAKIQNGVSNRQ